jgi:hypothetical protein
MQAEMINISKIWLANLMERDHMGELGADEG